MSNTKKIQVNCAQELVSLTGEVLTKRRIVNNEEVAEPISVADVIHYIFTVVPPEKDTVLARFNLAKKIKKEEVALSATEIIDINTVLDKAIELNAISFVEAGTLKDVLGV